MKNQVTKTETETEKVYLVDGWNANKVDGYFDSEAEAMEYVDAKEYTENWENGCDSFENFKSGFFCVTNSEMEDAVFQFGSRKKNYWT